jgi:FkbM family methyltransferase
MTLWLEQAGDSRAARALGRWLNRVAMPVTRLSVTVRGFRMRANAPDRFVALWLWKSGRLERAESDLIRRLSFPGMRALDIGANMGFHTLHLSRLAGADGRVWAWEPEASNARQLRENLAANGCVNVEVIEAAAGDRTCDGILRVSAAHHGDHRLRTESGELPEPGETAQPVRVVAVDDVVPPGTRIDLIKMDIQGGEGRALRGMDRILSGNGRQALLIEVTPDRLARAGTPAPEILAWLAKKGFALHEVLPGARWRPLRASDALARIPPGGYVNVLALRGDWGGAAPA